MISGSINGSARWMLLACSLAVLRVTSAADDTVFAHPIEGKALIGTLLAEPSRAMARAQVLQERNSAAFDRDRHIHICARVGCGMAHAAAIRFGVCAV
jgi:hypothetical protein